MINWRTVSADGATTTTLLTTQHAIERLQRQALQVVECFDILSARIERLEQKLTEKGVLND
jgi:hypothetical protein